MATEKWVCFWHETEVPYGFLSQWYACEFTSEGVKYCSTEHWMMLQKAKLFGDDETAEEISSRLPCTFENARHLMRKKPQIPRNTRVWAGKSNGSIEWFGISVHS